MDRRRANGVTADLQGDEKHRGGRRSERSACDTSHQERNVQESASRGTIAHLLPWERLLVQQRDLGPRLGQIVPTDGSRRTLIPEKATKGERACNFWRLRFYEKLPHIAGGVNIPAPTMMAS